MRNNGQDGLAVYNQGTEIILMSGAISGNKERGVLAGGGKVTVWRRLP